MDDNVSALPPKPTKSPVDSAINALNEQAVKAQATALKGQMEVTLNALKAYNNEKQRLDLLVKSTQEDRDLTAALVNQFKQT